MESILAEKYTISFNENGYKELNDLLNKKNYSKIFILTDENTNEYCYPKFISKIETQTAIELIEIESGELHKNLETCAQLWSILSDYEADRKSVMINLGGGVITDMGGFVASTYKRGIDFINIPTTLLSMVDASVGGKNGIDLGGLKNQIGTFNEPIFLLIDTSYLETLSQRELKSGLAEMLKHGLIFDALYWKQFSDIDALNFDDLEKLIFKSIEIKNAIVKADPKEQNIRKSLNFGHTLGHAIESLLLTTNNPLLHGEAIAIGMQMESFLSKEKQLLSIEEYNEIKNKLKSIYGHYIIDKESHLKIIELLNHDKKNEYGKVNFTLLHNIGNFKINQVIDNELIMKCFEEYNF